MVFLKSFGVSIITGIITEIFKITLLKITGDPNTTIVYSSIFSYIIAYVAQRYVFCGGRFFGISFLKYFAVSAITIQLYSLVLDKILNIPVIKNKLADKTLSDTKKKIYQYTLINITIVSIFICIDFPLRKYFIFVKNLDYDYIISYLLYLIAIIMYINLQ
jgi:hypothetical protein